MVQNTEPCFFFNSPLSLFTAEESFSPGGPRAWNASVISTNKLHLLSLKDTVLMATAEEPFVPLSLKLALSSPEKLQPKQIMLNFFLASSFISLGRESTWLSWASTGLLSLKSFILLAAWFSLFVVVVVVVVLSLWEWRATIFNVNVRTEGYDF